MTRTIRRLGPVVALALGATLMMPAPVGAIPPNSPKTGLICTQPTAGAFRLVARTGYIQTPDGNSVFMWGYGNADAPDNGAFQYPGPVLCVTQGQTVTVTLTNSLAEPASIVFPGQDSTVTASGGTPGVLTTEAAAGGGSVTYSFTASSPGTYLYESGSDISKQVEMGLYGALIVRPAIGPAYAYGTVGAGNPTAFDPSHEYLQLLSDFDPDLHHAVETGGTYDLNTLHNRYYAVNGRMFPDTLQDNGSGLLPAQPYGALVRIQPTNGGSAPALIRMLNAGLANHPYHPHGNHLTQIAQDGRQLLTPGGAVASTERFGETVASGQTQDYLLRWDDTDLWNPSNNPLPVAQPNYQNLTFKDGNTWYAGSPYLGYKGTLPVGTNSLNVCGEWYFPWHSHALNEFVNFNEPFGGMATLLRVDPQGGCFTFPSSTTLSGAALKSGTVTAMSADDATYYQVNPKTTTRSATTLSAGATTMTVTSAAGFPTTGAYFVRVENEVIQVTGGQGTTTWTVARGQLGTAATSHANNTAGRAVSGLADDWSATFTGVPAGSANLNISYKGKSCGSTTGSTCAAIASNAPVQSLRVCNWTLGNCATPWSPGWVPVAPATVTVGSTDVTMTITPPGPASAFIGTGANRGQVRVLVHAQRWTAPNPTPFSTWANLMKLTYDAP